MRKLDALQLLPEGQLHDEDLPLKSLAVPALMELSGSPHLLAELASCTITKNVQENSLPLMPRNMLSLLDLFLDRDLEEYRGLVYMVG